ncbi:MAG: DUF2489 domain-containing protein [Nitrospiraceae bacterium]|jgi:hypothetical protein|uniref:DUF2489 domain-containing protein n=1 Tax=Nitrospira cf. moscoviensis SBR1015 TaxID=96242 RepID=UPI000B3BC8EB|nr:DUF2489 domain-containing protein [Nitrospira cf. moscoviensis SBR1015]MBY0247684.1 DUF2489 domain-containing protein [Nitrospiraceae bacterium]
MSLPDIIKSRKIAELRTIATAMIEGRMQLVEGARKINHLRFAIDEPEHEVFKSIVAFEDDTEDFPLRDLRAEYEPNYLKRLDEKMNKLIEDDKADVLAACEEILRLFPDKSIDQTEREDGISS